MGNREEVCPRLPGGAHLSHLLARPALSCLSCGETVRGDDVVACDVPRCAGSHCITYWSRHHGPIKWRALLSPGQSFYCEILPPGVCAEGVSVCVRVCAEGVWVCVCLHVLLCIGTLRCYVKGLNVNIRQEVMVTCSARSFSTSCPAAAGLFCRPCFLSLESTCAVCTRPLTSGEEGEEELWVSTAVDV